MRTISFNLMTLDVGTSLSLLKILVEFLDA